MTPPPTIATFLTDPPAKRVALIQQQRAFRGNEGGAGDARRDLAARAVEPLVGSLEAAADDALLHPGLAFGELAVGREAGELRARPGAAGRAVVRLARAQHEVARARGGRGRPEQLHVIDVGKSLRVHRLADAPAGVGQRLHVFDFENLAVVLDEEKQVAAPRDIAGDAAEARHLDAHAFLPPPAR